MIRTIIGYFFVLLPFIAFSILSIELIGVIPTVIIWGIVGLITGSIIFGAWLVES